MPIIFFGHLFGSLFVLWFQVVIGNLKGTYYGWQLIVFCGQIFLTIGVSAFVTAIFVAGLSPDAFLFLIIGAGICTSPLLCLFLFGKRWSNITHHSSKTYNGDPLSEP
jgi:hypothetical protein